MARYGDSQCPAVFLDRDGTINVEKDYLHRIADFEFIPGVPEAISRLNKAGFKVVIVTNQSGVARGYFDLAQVERLHCHMDLLLEEVGAHIDGYYVCPHHPVAGQGEYLADCDCRKPASGLLELAAEDHLVDLRASFMVGDKLADFEAGEKAGCHSLLVRTGYGEETLKERPELLPHSFLALPAAVDFILEMIPKLELKN